MIYFLVLEIHPYGKWSQESVFCANYGASFQNWLLNIHEKVEVGFLFVDKYLWSNYIYFLVSMYLCFTIIMLM